MTTRTELIADLRRSAKEIANDGYTGWGNVCTSAADMLEADEKLSDELERERMRLAACGVVAMSDTPDSAKKARDMHPDYKSASCDDVARRVDECIKLREAARLALDALEQITYNVYDEDCLTHKVAAPAIAALKEVLK